MAADSSQQPEDFPYIQLWASADGETHIKEFKAKGFDLKKYASVRVLLALIYHGEDQCTRLQPVAQFLSLHGRSAVCLQHTLPISSGLLPAATHCQQSAG